MRPRAMSGTRAPAGLILGLVMMDRRQQGRPPGLLQAFANWLLTLSAVCHAQSCLRYVRRHHSTPWTKSQMPIPRPGSASVEAMHRHLITSFLTLLSPEYRAPSLPLSVTDGTKYLVDSQRSAGYNWSTKPIQTSTMWIEHQDLLVYVAPRCALPSAEEDGCSFWRAGGPACLTQWPNAARQEIAYRRKPSQQSELTSMECGVDFPRKLYNGKGS